MKYKLLLILFFIFPFFVYADEIINVNSEEDVISLINKVFEERVNEKYMLYINYNSNIDMDNINNYFMDNYMSDFNKNMYKYEEYGIYEPIKFPLKKKFNYIEFNSRNIKITKEEEQETSSVSNMIINKLNDKNDYEKVLYIYNYLKEIDLNEVNNIDYLKQNISVYDTLVNRMSTNKGLVTTFSYLMDILNIDSYIVEDISNKDYDRGTYDVNYVYNIVKIDNLFYKIDFMNNKFLTKIDNKNLYYNNLKLANKDYKNNIVIFEQKENKIIEEKDKYLMEYILIISILVIVFSFIYIFTRH